MDSATIAARPASEPKSGEGIARPKLKKLRPLPRPDPVPAEVEDNPLILPSVRKSASCLYRMTGGKYCLWPGNDEIEKRFGVNRRTFQQHLAILEACEVVLRFDFPGFEDWYHRVGQPIYGLPWPENLQWARRVIVVLSMLPRPAGCAQVAAFEPVEEGANPAPLGANPAPSGRESRARDGANPAPSSFKGSKPESSEGTRGADESALAFKGEQIHEPTTPASPAEPSLALALSEIRALMGLGGTMRKGTRAARDRPEAAGETNRPAEVAMLPAEPKAPKPAASPIPVRRPSDHVRNLVCDPDPARAGQVARTIGLSPRFKDTKPRTMATWTEAFALVQSGRLSAELIADLVDNACRKGARHPARLLSKSLAKETRYAKGPPAGVPEKIPGGRPRHKDPTYPHYTRNQCPRQ